MDSKGVGLMTPVGAMLAEHACASVCTRFYHHLDRREHGQLAALMAGDGVWMRQGKAVTGPQAVLESLAAASPDRMTRHLLCNVIIELLDGGGAARVGYDLAVFVQEGAGPAKQSGIFTGEDRLAHDGTVWCIVHKEASVLFRLSG